MSTSFTRTRNQIADLVLGKLGVAVAGVTADSAYQVLVYEALDMRLKEMHRLGVYWRKVTQRAVSFPVVANTVSVSASAVADILYPIALTLNIGSVEDRVDIISYTEYAKIPDKTRQGNPDRAMWTGNVSGEFILYPIPIQNSTMSLVYEKITDDSSASAGADIDVSMIRWMKDILAYDLGDQFEIDEAKMARFEREAAIAERNIRKLGNPKVSLATVAVDDWTSTRRARSDY